METPQTDHKKLKKPRKPTAHEDIVDGFAFLAFKNYEELSRAIRLGEEKSEKICVQVLKSKSNEEKRNAATNTSPNKDKDKSHQHKQKNKRKLKKLMDQENGDEGGRSSGGERSGGEGSSPFSIINPPPPVSSSHKTPKKNRITKEPFAKNLCENSEETSVASETHSNNKMSKILDTASDLFPVPRKDSSTCQHTDNLPSAEESPPLKVEDEEEVEGQSSSSASPPLENLKSSATKDSTVSSADSEPLATNGRLNGGNASLNGHEEIVQKATSFFTPYATNTITRVTPDPNSKSSFPTHKESSGVVGVSLKSSTGKVTPTGSGSGKSSGGGAVFGSIARLLDSPNTTTSSSSSNRSSPSVVHLSPGQQSAVRSHSPRGHSPSRERDSYSSNVSSLSRTSVTPHLPPANLSPQLSYFPKTASWLSSVPVPRPTPPPGPSQQQPQQPHQQHPHLSPYSHSGGSAAAMFAPPMLPFPSSSHFGPPDPLLHRGPNTSTSSELVRRDLESRFLAQAGQSQHHMGLQQTQSAQSQGQNQNPYAPQMMGKIDPGYYRGMPFSGFNGLLPPQAATPFAPPSQLPPFTPKKTGKWNAMHVRIAWEIYHHQQNKKEGGGTVDSKGNPSAPGSSSSFSRSSSSPLIKSSVAAPPPSHNDLFRPPTHVFPPPAPPAGLSRPGVDMGPYGASQMLTHQARPPTFDPSQHPHLFMQNQPPQFGPHLGRYGGFGGLGSSFGGLNSIGSSLLPPPPLSSVQDQWSRMGRSVAGAQWLNETRSRGNENMSSKEQRPGSPFRDRSPVRDRPSRTPNENGDSSEGGGRSSRSSEHSNSKEKARTNTPSDIIKSPYSSARMYPSVPSSSGGSSSSHGGGGGDGWTGYSSAEAFRLSLLQLGERERELSRLPRFPPSTASSSSQPNGQPKQQDS